MNNKLTSLMHYLLLSDILGVGMAVPYMSVEFVVCSHLALRVLSGFSGFPLHKNQHSKFQFDQNTGPA